MNKSDLAVRVLHVYRTYFPDPPGGVQEVIHQICQATRNFGVENTVFCLSPQPDPEIVDHHGIPVWRSRSWAAPASCDLGGPEAFRRFAELAGKSDIVHFHFPWPFSDLLHLMANPLCKTVVTYHSDIIRQTILAGLYAPLMWRTLSRMDAIIATSPNYAETSPVLQDKRIRERVQIIPLAITERALSVRTDLPGKSTDWDSTEPYFLFVGVLRYYKGLETLIDAAKHVKARFIIAGDGPQGPLLHRQARKLGCSNVEFAGQISDTEKFRLLQGCRAFVLPSHLRSEAFGVSLLEAAMCAKPLVSCEIGTGTSYVNQHELTGLVVNPEDPTALSDALNRLLDDESLARKFGLQARERFETLFSSPALGVEHDKLYRRILA